MERVLSPKEGEQFLKDLAETRLGVGVTEQEAKTIFDLTKKVQETKAKANEQGVFPTKDSKLDYGIAQVDFEEGINKLKLQSKKISFREQPLKYGTDLVGKTPGLFKSLLSSLDDSFFGRQGIKTLLDIRTSHLWFKNFAKSFKDIGKEILGNDAMRAIKADIYSRPNALNGKYKAGKYGLDVLSEEAFPSSLPGRIPLLGRLYKASESAYNGGALRLRADLADRAIANAEKHGLNMLDPKEAEGLGHVISSLTGRGSLGKGDVLAKEANVLLFSIKFLKANFDTLTAHILDSKASGFAKKEAAKNLLSMTVSVATILATAKFLDPNSVEEDPRSTNFGKVKVFGRWVDITGGMAPMITLAMRLAPTIHNGQWGFWTKSKSGAYTSLTSGKYGQDDALDTFENFFEGKLSPALGIARDVWKGKTYSGDKPTPENLAKGVVTPISVQSFQQMMKDPTSSNVLASMILEGLGFSSAPITYSDNWEGKTSKEMLEFKEKKGQDKFEEANDKFNQKFNSWFAEEIKKDEYKSKSDEDKIKTVSDKKEDFKEGVFKEYNFKPTKEKAKPKKKSGSLFK